VVRNPGKIYKYLLLSVIGSIFLSGCAGWRLSRDVDAIDVPDQFHNENTSENLQAVLFKPDEPWWLVFNDQTLNGLMQKTFSDNLSLKASIARVEQVRALYASSTSSRYPSLSISGKKTESGEVGDSQPVTAPFSFSPQNYEFGLSSTYEIDLWGKLSSSRKAAAADLVASEEDLRAFTFSLSAQLAKSYFTVIELRQQRDLLKQTISSYKDYNELVMERYLRGVAVSLDVYQSEINLTGARAQEAQVEARLAAVENAFGTMLGQYPSPGLIPENANLSNEFPEISPGLPSELINRRPDVRSANFRLVAADKRSAEAVASRFPRFSLTGTVGGSSDELADALDPENMIWNAIGNVIVPVFEGGRLKANADRAEATWLEQSYVYKQTLLNAFREVEDALAKRQNYQERIAQLQLQSQAASSSVRLATDRYLQGVTDYLPVVHAQTSYLNARRSLITARRELIDSYVELAVALGGGWTDDILDQIVVEID